MRKHRLFGLTFIQENAHGQRCLGDPYSSALFLFLWIHSKLVTLRTFVVEEVEREADLGAVEPGVLLGQPPLPLHVEHQVAAAHELDHEEEPRRRLQEGVSLVSQ